jgi:MFS family permease
MNQPKSKEGKIFSALTIVAALGYFVDIYDLVLFSVEWRDSLRDLMGHHVAMDIIEKKGKFLLSTQMAGMLIGGIIWGIIGDKKGRLSVLFGSILMYSIANILNGFVTNVEQYTVLRFISGFGLAGELGVGITLVSETLSTKNRGYGATFVATIGVFGAVVAGFASEIIETQLKIAESWRYSFFIGGGLGIILLLMRLGVYESGMFEAIKKERVSRGNFIGLVTNKESGKKFLSIVLATIPVWYVMGILITFCSTLLEEMGATFEAKSSTAIAFAYIGITVGDLASGLLSQYLKSRKKVMFIFVALLAISTTVFLTTAHLSETWFLTITLIMGFFTGYWAVFITTASELFGTNIRATATTSAPNFVRGSVILLTYLSIVFKNWTGSLVSSAAILGFLVIGAALFSIYRLPETFHKDLNYTE